MRVGLRMAARDKRVVANVVVYSCPIRRWWSMMQSSTVHCTLSIVHCPGFSNTPKNVTDFQILKKIWSVDYPEFHYSMWLPLFVMHYSAQCLISCTALMIMWDLFTLCNYSLPITPKFSNLTCVGRSSIGLETSAENDKLPPVNFLCTHSQEP
jgi:hypothetical protein